MSESQNKKSAVKKSVLLAGLIGTGGLFVSKLIGLVYAIPFSTILGSDSYMSIYGQAYNIYSYVLTVFQSGIPFAIATLVAKYMELGDAKAVQLVKKLGLGVLGITGFVGMVAFAALSGLLAPIMVSDDIEIMARCLQLLSLAIFFVPVLSSFRGYYQGLKEMSEYAFSQAFEQFFRVGFLLGISYLAIYILGMDRKWALYISVFSTSVAAVVAIVQFMFFDHKHKKEVDDVAKSQTIVTVDQKQLLKEMVILAIPYMFVALLGNIESVYNSMVLPTGLRMHGYSVADQSTIISAATYVGTKLTAIPMILGPGFANALVPHITSALTAQNYKLVRKNVCDSLNAVLYIACPVCFCLFLYAEPLFYTLFHTDNLVISTAVTQWWAIEGLLGTITPLVTNLMVILGLKKNTIKRLIISTIIKGTLLVPMTWAFGFPGAVYASIIGGGYLILANLREISIEYKVSYKRTYRMLIHTGIGIAALTISYFVLSYIGLGGIAGSRMISFVKMCANGMISVIMFALVTIMLGVPQRIFHVDISGLAGKILRRGR
ncbi:MAG: oligosaccharide flippase family protein [Firmicutes bacterium]|nr:oligosaccharide flippase family protein [Bacillota bacterium]